MENKTETPQVDVITPNSKTANGNYVIMVPSRTTFLIDGIQVTSEKYDGEWVEIKKPKTIQRVQKEKVIFEYFNQSTIYVSY